MIEWKSVPAALMFLMLYATAANAEIQPPEAGITVKFKCSGPYREGITINIVKVDGDMYRIEYDEGGKAQWVEKPIASTGLTVFKRRQKNDGKGERTQTLDDDVLGQYMKLEPGSVFEFDVRERHSTGKWRWGYKVKVGQPETISHEVIGEIQVVPVSENRRVWNGKYSSKYNTVVYPKGGMAIAWTYKDSKGTEECKLVEVS